MLISQSGRSGRRYHDESSFQKSRYSWNPYATGDDQLFARWHARVQPGETMELEFPGCNPETLPGRYGVRPSREREGRRKAARPPLGEVGLSGSGEGT